MSPKDESTKELRILLEFGFIKGETQEQSLAWITCMGERIKAFNEI